MRKNKVYRLREVEQTPNPIKLVLLTLALVFQVVQAASIEVTSNADDSTDCSLREAIETVNAGVDQNNGCLINGELGTADAISFGAGVSGNTIVLNDVLTITQSVRINTGGAPTTIDANGVSRVLNIDYSGCSPPCGNTDVTVELDHLTLTGGNSAGVGGGIFVISAIVKLINSTVSDNVAGRDGGGIYVFEGFLTLTNSTVLNNSANSGGGVYVEAASMSMTNSMISDNTASQQGGGVLIFYSEANLINSTVSSNNAGIDGGGIYARFTLHPVNLSNITVSGNSAGRDGGGIFVIDETTVMLNNSTVSDNSAISSGGGIHIHQNSNVALSNSIVANSTTADCSAAISSSATATVDSIIEDGSCNTTAKTVDPALVPLADNGGPTPTHALLLGSPAIDNGTAPGATTTDQRGIAAEGVRDSGAYEFTGAINTITLEKLINHRTRETPDAAAQLFAGTRYRVNYKVTNNSLNRVYNVQVFESGQLVCNLYSIDAGESKQRYACGRNQNVLAGDNNVPATATAKVSGSKQILTDQNNAYYTGNKNLVGKLSVTHYINEKNADTQASAFNIQDSEAEVLFRIENTGRIELYRVNTFHDPASPINSGWQRQCFIGTLEPGQIRYCKRTISITQEGLNKTFGRAQGTNANVSATSFVNASNPTYFNVVLP